MISCRPKSPNRADAIAIALRPQPVYCTGVLLGNWVEERIECPKAGTFYFPPKEEIDHEKMKPESRKSDSNANKLNDLNGGVGITIRHDSHDACKNFVTTNDLVYSHLPKPLCGPVQRYYRDCKHQWYPQPDNMECFGNLTEWGLRRFKQQEWACTDVSDYSSTLYDDSYIPPRRDQYLQPCERKARNGLVGNHIDPQISILEAISRITKKFQMAATFSYSSYGFVVGDHTQIPRYRFREQTVEKLKKFKMAATFSQSVKGFGVAYHTRYLFCTN